MLKPKNLDDPKLIDALQKGAVGIMPSDTVYGIMCRAADDQAAERLYKIKSRDNKPGTVIAASLEQLIELGIPARYLKPVAHFWPGPISIVVPCGPELGYLHLGKQSLAVRVVRDQSLVGLLREVGPLLTSSANHPGQSPADTVKQAESYFGDEVDFYVDGGDLSGRAPSTIVQIIDDEVVVLREGAVKINKEGEIE